MRTELLNGSGQIYLTIEYDHLNQWVYNNWIGLQTHIGILAGADACLGPLWENACSYLLNDNRQARGPWNQALPWLVHDWAPRARAQGLTHLALIVSPDEPAADSARALQQHVSQHLHMSLFDELGPAQIWLQQAQWQAR